MAGEIPEIPKISGTGKEGCNIFGYGSEATDSDKGSRFVVDGGRATDPNVCLDAHGYLLGEERRADAIAFVSTIKQVEYGIIAVANAMQLIKNFRRIRKTRRRINDLQRRALDRLRNIFWNRELEFLKEHGGSEPSEKVDDLIAIKRRLIGRAKAAVAAAYRNKYNALKCSATRYCQNSFDMKMQDLMLLRSIAMTNAYIIGSDLAFTEMKTQEDVNWKRRMQAIGLGKGLVGYASSYREAALGALQSNMGAIAGKVNSALEGLGYANQMYRGVDFHAGAMNMAGGDIRQQVLSGSSAPVISMPAGMPAVTVGGVTNGNGASVESRRSGVISDPAETSSASFHNPIAGASSSGLQDSLDTPADFLSASSERINSGDVMNRSLVRSGKHTYRFVDSDGDRGEITIDMDDFDLQYSEGMHPKGEGGN